MSARRFCIGVAVGAAIAFTAGGCGGKTKTNQNNNGCPEGFEVRDSACVPIFDECPGPVEIPVLGGGCRPVGVIQCGTGFVSDGEGGCEPVLPSEPCHGGTVEVIGETECQPVGVTDCAPSFVPDGEGGCDAILPLFPCPSGTIEILGETECQPIGDCGSAPWGNIPIDGSTVFVDQTADPTSADGSQSNPFPSVNEALAAVTPGGRIAVAEGEYAERLIIGKPVELIGRCAELVVLRGTTFLGQPRPPVTINSAGTGTTLEGVTLTGDGVGLLIHEAQQVTVEQVQVLDTGSYGINAFNEAEASLVRVVVARCTEEGIFSIGATLQLTESVVRDTRPLGGGNLGRGIEAFCVPSAFCGSLTLTRSLIQANTDYGIMISGADATITSTVIRDTQPTGNGRSGRGIEAKCDNSVDVCGTLDVTSSVISGNADYGIMLGGVQAAIVSTVVRDTQSNGLGRFGRGIEAICHPDVGECGSLTVSRSMVAGNADIGIRISGPTASITSTVVKDTQPEIGDETGGRGISVACDHPVGACSTVTVTGSLIEGNMDVGFMAFGADVEISSSVVRGTRPEYNTQDDGIGIEATCDAVIGRCGSLTMTGSLVEENMSLGIVVFGTDTTIDSVLVQDTLAQQSDGSGGRGINAQCHVSLGICGSLNVTGSLVRRNRSQGIFTAGMDANITSTVVRDTLDQDSDRRFGRGIEARCHENPRACGSINVENSLVHSSYNLGIFLSGVPATLADVAVLDTRPNEDGPWRNDFGQAVWAMCDENTGGCATLEVTSCLLDSSYGAGLAAKGIPGSIESSVIRSVLPRLTDQAYGYGLQLEGLQGLQPLIFDVRTCVIQGCSLAGILYHNAGGTITGSMIGGGQYAVAASVGSLPEISDDNLLSGSRQDDIYWSNLAPSPAPAPAIPAEGN